MLINGITDASSLLGQVFPCACGRQHAISIRHIQIGKGAIYSLGHMAKPFAEKTVYLVGDENTLPPVLLCAMKELDAAGCKVVAHTFPIPSGRHLITEERLVGSMLLHMPPNTGLIVAAGSGTMNDTARVISAKCGIPYIILATAPSMDGYASVTSAVVMDGGKKSVPLCAPYGIIGDTDILRTAPDHMLTAGAGDMLGKYTALRDWELAARETGEAWCPEIAGLVSLAAGRVVERIRCLFNREEGTLKELMDALVLSGLAILLNGTSRPAAGLEHQIAHYFEVEALRRDFYDGLHGHYVGLSTLAACRLYEMAEAEFDLPGRGMYPAYRQMQDHMTFLQPQISLKALGITPACFENGILHAGQPEIRYTLASYLHKKGRLTDYARRLTEEFFS